MKTVKMWIDGDVFTRDLFEANGKRLTTDLLLPEGQHTLTKIEVYDGDDLKESHDLSVSFSLIGTFTAEIPIEYGGRKMSMRVAAVVPAPTYLKIPKEVTPPEMKTAKFIGILGIPEADKHFYVDDDFYGVKPITNKVKLRFQVTVWEKGDGSEWRQKENFMYNWGEMEPLIVNWMEASGTNPVKLVFTMYYAATQGGDQSMRDINCGYNCDTWQIVLNGKDMPISNGDGITTLSLMPDDSWLSDADYQFEYIMS